MPLPKNQACSNLAQKKLHPLRGPKEQEAERKFFSIFILFYSFNL